MKRFSFAVLPFLFASLLAAQSVPGEVEITAEHHHHIVLQNQYVRVFSVEVAPHSATLMHRHRHDYMFVTLGASDLENDIAGTPPVSLKLQDGETRFAPGNFAHIAKNLADTPFRNITIEFLQDEKAHQTPPPKWDEERGVDVLQGGTRDILFVKDGARVSEMILQPGGVQPQHRHAGPHLVVAVSDLHLRSDAPGQKATRAELKSGEVRWVPAGLSHSITNVGQQPARWVTVEFH